MPYIPVPKDLTKVKSKVLFNLTKRQLVCFGGGALVGVPLFFLLKGPLGNSSAAICMIVAMMPFFLFALYEKNGLPLEKYLLYLIRTCFISSRTSSMQCCVTANLLNYARHRSIWRCSLRRKATICIQAHSFRREPGCYALFGVSKVLFRP